MRWLSDFIVFAVVWGFERADVVRGCGRLVIDAVAEPGTCCGVWGKVGVRTVVVVRGWKVVDVFGPGP